MFQIFLEDISKLNTINSQLEKLAAYASMSFTRDLKKIIKDNDSIQTLSDTAYLHANGFLKMTLARNPDGSKLRLHIWDDALMDYTNAQLSAHNHPWSFCSFILCGGFRNTIYKTSNDGELHQRHTCLIDGEENYGHSIVKKGSSSLIEISNTVMKKGSYYYEFSEEIHRVSPERSTGITSTLVYQHHPSKRESDLYLKTSIEKSVSNKIVSKEIIKNSITSLLMEMQNG